MGKKPKIPVIVEVPDDWGREPGDPDYGNSEPPPDNSDEGWDDNSNMIDGMD